MVDSTQLLSHPISHDSNIHPHQDDEHVSSLSSTIDQCIGKLTWSQFLKALLVSFAWFFDAQQSFITIFTDAQPSWHCTKHSNNTCSSTTSSNMCNLPKDSWAWDEPTQASMISEWGLECKNSFITGFPASSFFIGCLVGGFLLSTLADSTFGRKNMLLYSCFLMSISSLLASFSTNIWIYSALKFLSGIGRATIGTTLLVLASELVSKRWRGQVGALGFFFCSIGFLTLPAIAYLNKGCSWRNLYVWTSLPAILYCVLVFFLVPESPRWLLLKGRKEEAVKILNNITSITQSNLNLFISTMPYDDENEVRNVDLYSALKILMKKKWSSRRLLTTMTMGLGLGLVYYGMPLGLGSLSFNLYLSVTFNAISEIPSTLVTFILLGKCNRRIAIFLLAILSGISSILAIIDWVIRKRLQIVFELVSFFCSCIAFDTLLVYTTELFPTCVRSFALSLVRQATMLGGALSPVLVAAGRRENNDEFLCYGVFGLAIVCSGILALFLPETKGKTLCDTIDEEENKESSAILV